MAESIVSQHLMVVFLLWVAGVSSQDASLITYTVMEEDAPGTLLGNVVIDSELKNRYPAEVLSILRFSFLEQDEATGNDRSGSDLFTINNDGELRTRYRINREEFCANKEACILPLDVQVQPSQYFQILKIEVQVDDVNDNTPRFPGDYVTLALSEASVVGSLLNLPVAIDEDSPMFGVQTYRLVESDPAFELLMKDNGGSKSIQLKQVQGLDREKKASYNLKLQVLDGGNPPKSDITTIIIEVIDVDDNPTLFEKELYEVMIPENTAVDAKIITVRATDADTSGSDGLMYGFSSKSLREYGDTFSMDNSSGNIFIKKELDFEKIKVYDLEVTAQDKTPGAIPTLAKVTIRILDINDNAPKIKLNSLTSTGHAQISEFATKGSFVVHITINDMDSGENGQFDCSLNNDLFDLEKLYPTEFKLITKATFNRESQADYDVTLSCTDKGSPPLTTKKIIPVTILDENDNAPEFIPTSYSTSILENSKPGVSIIQVYAKDADFGDNAVVKYELDAESSRYFNIDENSGNITTMVELDHEEYQQFQIRVFAHDLGSPSKTATANVHIDIIDQDDEIPKFLQSHYTFVVPENQDANVKVGQVEASDRDSEPFSQFKYDVESPLGGQLKNFRIDAENGMIYTTTSLNREEGSVYYLTVLAISQNLNPSTSSASVTIYISDMNDHVPQISFPSQKNDTIYIPSSLPQGEAITQIQATDKDSGSNAHLLYSIESGNEKGLFVMDTSSGYIFVGSHLDSQQEFQVYKLKVKVQDGGLPPRTAEAILNVIVNRSLPINGHDLMPQENLTIVIVIACMSGLLVVVLTIAIVAIVRQQKKRKNVQKYNNMAHNLNPAIVIEPSKENKDDVSVMMENNSNNSISVVYPKKKKRPNHGNKGNNKDANYVTSQPDAVNLGEKDEGDRRKKKEVSFAVNGGLDISEEDINLQQPLSIQTGHMDLPAEDRDSGCSMDTSNADSGQGSTNSDDVPAFDHPNNLRMPPPREKNHHHRPHHPHHHGPSYPHPAHNHHRQYSHDVSLPSSPVIRTQGLKPGYSAPNREQRNSFNGMDSEKPALPPRENRGKSKNDISQMFARDVLYKDLQKGSSSQPVNPKNICRVHGLPSKKQYSQSQGKSSKDGARYDSSGNFVNLHEISTEVQV